MIRKIFASLLLAAFAGSTTAAPVTLHLAGSWESISSDQNLSVTATFDSASVDQEASPLIGAYPISGITFGFEHLGSFASPFSLIGDPAQTTLHLYPSSAGSSTGELRVFGQFASGSALPNGLVPLEFDLRLTFAQLDGDGLQALASVGSLVSSTFYWVDQVGARSSSIDQPTATVNFDVPEPNSAYLLAIALVAAAWVHRRNR